MAKATSRTGLRDLCNQVSPTRRDQYGAIAGHWALSLSASKDGDALLSSPRVARWVSAAVRTSSVNT